MLTFAERGGAVVDSPEEATKSLRIWYAILATIGVVIGLVLVGNWSSTTNGRVSASDKTMQAEKKPTAPPSVNISYLNVAYLGETSRLNALFAHAGAPNFLHEIVAENSDSIIVTIDADVYEAQSDQDKRRTQNVLETVAISIWKKYLPIPENGVTFRIRDLSNTTIFSDYDLRPVPR